MLPPVQFPFSGTGVIDRALDFFRRLGSRLLVHVLAIFFAALVSSSLQTDAYAGGSVVFAAYIGLICLVPRGNPRTADWVIPSALGVFLVTVWTAWGVPWQFCLLWGGALTWVIRFLAHLGKGGGLEWPVLPFMALGFSGFFESQLPLSPVTPPYWVLPVLAAAGWSALKLYTRLKGDSEQKAMLADACAQMEKLLQSGKAPPELSQTIQKLTAQGRQLLELKPRLDQSTADLARTLNEVAGKLPRMGSRLSPIALAQTRDSLERLALAIEERLRALEPPKEETPQSAEAKALAARLEEFRAMARQLSEKARLLPGDLQQPIQGIVRSTDSILTCMAEDPQDVAAGDRFLSRYLKAAHTVVDEHGRLAPQAGASREVSEALAKSRDLLLRLEKAFSEEHAALLRNDTLNFTAELNVLDKLLKMEGK